MESFSTGSIMDSKGANQSSIDLRVTLRSNALTKLAFDSPILFLATSTVAATAAWSGIRISWI